MITCCYAATALLGFALAGPDLLDPHVRWAGGANHTHTLTHAHGDTGRGVVSSTMRYGGIFKHWGAWRPTQRRRASPGAAPTPPPPPNGSPPSVARRNAARRIRPV